MSSKHRIKRHCINGRYLPIIALVLFITGCAEKESPDWTVRQLVEHLLSVFPEMTPHDVYKFMHQASFGPGHMGLSVQKEMYYLKEEFGSVEPDKSELLTVPISRDRKIVLVNLRHFKALGGRWGRLHEAIQKTKRVMAHDSKKFNLLWSEYIRLVIEGQIEMDESEVLMINSQAIEKGYPTMHHSEEFTEAYHPAYRVVSLPVFKNTFPWMFEK